MGSTKLLLSDRRNRLGDNIIEACECMKAWEKEGFLKSGDTQQMEDMLNELEARSCSQESRIGREE
jgi:hypothetical protein